MAYVSPATIASIENENTGLLRLVLRFTGNAGEPEVLRQFVVSEGMVAADVRRFVYDEVRRLNAKRTVFSGVSVGQNVPELAPSAAPAPTQKQVWLEKVARYLTFREVGLTGAGATALQALLTDINATYAAGFLDA